MPNTIADDIKGGTYALCMVALKKAQSKGATLDHIQLPHFDPRQPGSLEARQQFIQDCMRDLPPGATTTDQGLTQTRMPLEQPVITESFTALLDHLNDLEKNTSTAEKTRIFNELNREMDGGSLQSRINTLKTEIEKLENEKAGLLALYKQTTQEFNQRSQDKATDVKAIVNPYLARFKDFQTKHATFALHAEDLLTAVTKKFPITAKRAGPAPGQTPELN